MLTGTYVDMRQQGILDSLRVTRGALELATSAAISVMTTGVVVLPRQRSGTAVSSREHRSRS